MALIDEIVPVIITRETISAIGNNFGTILILGNSVPALNPNVKEYTSLTEVLADFANNTQEYLKASKIFAQVIKTPKILIGQVTEEDADYASAYNRISSSRNDFYALTVCSDEDDDIVQVATIIETQEKIFGVSTALPDVLTKTNNDLFSRLNTANLLRTFGIFSKAPQNQNYPEAAWLGRMIPSTPGASTWCYHNLAGVTATSNLTATERANLVSNNANFYSFFGGQDSTMFGTMCNGEFIDVVVGLDWMKFYIQSNLANLLTSVSSRFDKIPMTKDGITLVKNNLNASLEQAVTNKIIEPDFIITAPDILDVSPTNKAARTLDGIEFRATRVGAIHKFDVQGLVTI